LALQAVIFPSLLPVLHYTQTMQLGAKPTT